MAIKLPLTMAIFEQFWNAKASPELEEEANQKYGIQSVPCQVADPYQASIVSSCFNALVQYGDELNVAREDLSDGSVCGEADIGTI